MNDSVDEFKNLMQRHGGEIALHAVELQYRIEPDLFEKSGKDGFNQAVRDTGYHLPFLTEAVAAEDPELFTTYVDWVKTLNAGLKLPQEALQGTLECLKSALCFKLPETLHPLFIPVMEAGMRRLSDSVSHAKTFISKENELGEVCRNYTSLLLAGRRHDAGRLIQNTIDSGVSVRDIYLKVFQPSQYEIGRLWLGNQVSVAREHYCTAATQMIMSQLYPHVFSSNRIGKGMVAAAVGGELHELGIRMVTDFFEMEGWDTYYLGANTPAKSLIKAIEEFNAILVGLSVSMTFHRDLLRETIREIRNSEAGRQVRILIGGHAIRNNPVDWKSFGADGYATDASEAIQLAKTLIA